MRFLGWIVGLPLAAAIVVFAVRNRAMVDVDLWPSGFVVGVPLYVLVLGALAFGFVLGGAVVWLGQGRWRRLVRRQRRTLTRIEREQARDEGHGAPRASTPPATTLPARSGG